VRFDRDERGALTAHAPCGCATSPSGSMPYWTLGGRLCSFNDA